jgi:hypothetical protein
VTMSVTPSSFSSAPYIPRPVSAEHEAASIG